MVVFPLIIIHTNLFWFNSSSNQSLIIPDSICWISLPEMINWLNDCLLAGSRLNSSISFSFGLFELLISEFIAPKHSSEIKQSNQNIQLAGIKLINFRISFQSIRNSYLSFLPHCLVWNYCYNIFNYAELANKSNWNQSGN